MELEYILYTIEHKKALLEITKQSELSSVYTTKNAKKKVYI